MCLSNLLYKVFSTNLGFFNPYELNFAITYNCNSRCKTCNIWKIKSKNELTLKEIEKIVENNKFINWIRLTGGEPFLRNDYTEIVKILDKNLNLYLLSTPTNGLSTDLIYKNVKHILKFFRKRYIITVSLDGTQKIHDKIKGIKGSWLRAIKTYKKLKDLEKQYKNFKMFFGYTISPFNVRVFMQTLNEVNEILSKITVNDFHINLFQTSNIYYHTKRIKISNNYFKDTEKEINVILNKRKKSFNPISSIENKYLILGKKYLEVKKTPVKCNIFNLSCFVDPYGNVYPCTIFDRKLGNLRENDYNLKKILTSETAKKVKQEIIKNKCSQCWTPCEAHQLILSNWWRI